ncbi:MAG: TAT-variant-translocated molybdopterin oxidoreductase [Bacteroidota bacterium]|jgi:molybdopterin-containing oxidoreductase family iron-sulfur binding subunit
MKTGKEYWLSLRDKSDTPEYRALVEREFPEGTLELASSMNRRTFMTLMGASMALAGLTSCRRPEEKIVPYVSKPEEITLGNGLLYATSMPLGTENYSLLVHAREGRPVKIMGNALDAHTGTATNAWVSASILGLYDPDRSQTAIANAAESSTQGFVGTWTTLHAKYAANGGTGLALLCQPFASPTMQLQLDAFRAAFPAALVATWDAVSDTNQFEGHRAVFGRPLRPVYDFTQADIVLALDADLFGGEYGAFENARGFAAGRRVEEPEDTMNRLYIVEPSLSQTTSLADHRLRLPAGRIPNFAAALLHALAARGLSVPASLAAAAPADKKIDALWVDAVAEDLLAHRGRAIVAAGRSQDAAVHALVAVINNLLGNTGRTVRYAAQPFANEADPASLASLTAAMSASKVETLVILGGNPVFDAPADLDFRTALGNVGTSVHTGLHRDETALACTWHLPLRHYLEAWGDVSSMHGHIGVIQPLIEPLNSDGISDVELLSLLIGGKLEKGYALVKATWQQLVPGLSDRVWRGILHDGLFPREIALEAPAADAAAAAAIIRPALFKAPALSANNMELIFRLSPAIHDGRFANNGWLQEFPDPVTKLTWDNAALMSLGTARELGLKDGDLVRLNCAGREPPCRFGSCPVRLITV